MILANQNLRGSCEGFELLAKRLEGRDRSFPAGCQAACFWWLKLNRPGKEPG